MKIVINKCFGGFGLSPEATLKLYERGVLDIACPVTEYWGLSAEKLETDNDYRKAIRLWRKYLQDKELADVLFLTIFSPDEKYALRVNHSFPRNHPELIRVVEEMGENANGALSELKIIEIPDDVEFEIEEYGGREHIAEKHRTWY